MCLHNHLKLGGLMTDSDIMTAYPDKNELQDEILQSAYLVRAELELYTKWMDSSNLFLKYNAKKKVEKTLNSSYFVTKYLQKQIDNCKNQFEKLSNDIGGNIHQAYDKGTLNEVMQSQYEKILRFNNGYTFSFSLEQSVYNLCENWWKSMFDEEFLPKEHRETRNQVSAQSKHITRIKEFNQKQFNFKFKPVTE
tara:strand:- start:57 stop:638 length:582 start_codon:yes stop_codon:yes gene_type:complete